MFYLTTHSAHFIDGYVVSGKPNILPGQVNQYITWLCKQMYPFVFQVPCVGISVDGEG